MASLPLLSIIIPVYNAEKYLKRCIDSIISSTYSNLEIIMVDDGSKDQSGSICDEYSEKDNRCRVYHTNNRGQAAARNFGLQHTSGDYITFVDDDDWIDNSMYEKLINTAIATESTVTGCSTLKEYSDGSTRNEFEGRLSGQVSGKSCNLDILYQNKMSWGSLWNKIFNRKIFRGGYTFPEGEQLEDYFVIIKIFNEEKNIYFLNEPLYHYTVREDSQSHKCFSEEKLSIIKMASEIQTYITENSSDKELIAAANYFKALMIIDTLWMCYQSTVSEKDQILSDYKNVAGSSIKKISININHIKTKMGLIFKYQKMYS